MKTKRILKESDINSVTSLISRHFKVAGTYEETKDGVIIHGTIENQISGTGQNIPQIPFKIKSVTDDCSFERCKLKSLENFPESVGETLNIDGNPIKSLRGLENTHCKSFDASNTLITDLEGCPKARKYVFKNCKELTSTKGLDIKGVTFVNFAGSTKIIDISSLLEYGSGDVIIKILYNPEMPIVKAVLMNGIEGYARISFDKVDPKLEAIIREYSGKGWGNVLELIRKMTDAGFGSNAKL